jgi:hypothetical protein
MLPAADADYSQKLTPEIITNIVALVPDEWLVTDSPFTTAEEHRQAYVWFLTTRIAHSATFVKAAIDARATLI